MMRFRIYQKLFSKIGLFLLVMIFSSHLQAQYTVTIEDGGTTVGPFNALPASFGPINSLCGDEVTGMGATPVDFEDGDPTLCNGASGAVSVEGKIAFIDRGACEFGVKCLNAERAGAIAVVVCNNVDTDPIIMGPGANGDQVTIPCFMVSQEDCVALRAALESGTVTLRPDLPVIDDSVAVIWGEEEGQGDFSGGLNDWLTVGVEIEEQEIEPLEWMWGTEFPTVFANASIASPSACDGAVIFDMQTVNAETDELIFSAGLLVSPIMDLSASSKPILSFYQNNIPLNGGSSVRYSIDGGVTYTEFVDIGTENILNSNEQNIVGTELIEVPIPDAAGQSEVVLQFFGFGDAYFWIIDDVRIIQRNTLAADQTEISVGAEGGSTTFNVSANVEWTASTDSDWFTIDVASGSGDAEVTINYEANESRTRGRSGTITLESVGGLVDPVTITVSQEALRNFLRSNPDTLLVAREAGTSSFMVETDLLWSARESSDWLAISPNSGFGDGSVDVTFDENTSDEERTTTVNVSSVSGPSIDVVIIQEGAGMQETISVDPVAINVDAAAGEAEVAVTSNTNWVAGGGDDWVSFAPSAGEGDDIITVKYDENTSLDPRQTTITLSTGSGESASVVITQAGAAAFISVDPMMLDVGVGEGDASVAVNSNESWTASSDVEWLAAIPDAGSGDATVTISYLGNSSIDARTGTVTFTAESGGTSTVTVTQAGIDCDAEVDGGRVALEDESTEATIFIDGEADVLTFSSDGAEGDSFTYVVTDDNNNILSIPDGNMQDFDGAGAGVCRVWGLSYTGELSAMGGDNVDEVDLSDACFELSANFITVTRIDCSEEVTGGTVALDDGSTETTIIIDDEADVLTFTSEGADEDASFAYVITDDSNMILALPEGNMADLNGAGVGVCRVWGLSYTGDLTAMAGDNTDEADLSSECFELSDNFITVTREEAVDPTEGNVIINEVSACEQQVELKNVGETDVDVSGWQLCNFPAYDELGGSNVTIISGDLMLSPGEIVVLGWGPIAAEQGEVGIYKSGPFGDSANIRDYVQYGVGDNRRAGVAVEAGVWDDAASFITLPTCESNNTISVDNTLSPTSASETSSTSWCSTSNSLGAENADCGTAVACEDSVAGGTVALDDGSTEITIIVDEEADVLTFTSEGADEDASFAYVITDDSNMILALPEGNMADLNGAGVGVCRVWGLSYTGDLTAMGGDNVDQADLSSECFELSENFITVTRNAPAECEVEGGAIAATDAGNVQNRVVIANRASGTISVIDGDEGSVIGTYDMPDDGEPMYVVYNPMNNSVLVGDYSGQVAAFDGRDFSVLGTASAGDGVFHMWISSDYQQLWVNNELDLSVSVIDPNTLQTITTFGIPTDLSDDGFKPHDVIVDPDNSSAYVTMLKGDVDVNYVVKYDATTFEEVGRAEVGADPHVSLTANNDFLYVASQGADLLQVLNRSDLSSVTTIDVPNAHGLGMNAAGTYLYIGNISDGGTAATYTLDLATNTLVGDPVDAPYAAPHNYAVGSGDSKLYLTHSGGSSDKVSMYDLGPTPSLAGELTVGMNPFGLAAYSFVDDTELNICAGDGVSDAFNATLEGNTGSSAWVITDSDGNILALPAGPPFDLDGAGEGVCLVWHLSFEEGNFSGAEVGNNALEDLMGCYDLSNPIRVIRETVEGGTVALDDGSTEITITVDDEADVLTFMSDGATGDNFTFVITDDANNILAVPGGNMADLNGAGVGVCRIWGLSYTGDLTAMLGDNAGDVNLSSRCFDLSDNFITVTREEAVDPTEGNVIINEVSACEQQVELKNVGETDVDVSSWFLCNFPAYEIFTSDNITIISGDLMLSPGEIVVLEWSDIADGQGEIGLYRNGPFGNAANIRDYVQYGSGDNRRAGVAVEAGVWDDAANFITLPTCNNTISVDNTLSPTGATSTNSTSWCITTNTLGDENADCGSAIACEDIVAGGTVALDDGSTEITIIVDDVADVLTFTSEGADEDASFAYVITDDSNMILALPEGNMADLNGAGVGVCRVWGLSYTGDLTAMAGDNTDEADLSSECFELSDNFITVTREAAPLPATVVEIIMNSEAHDTLETALNVAGLTDDLSGEGPFTVFAPTDDAFAALPAGILDALLEEPTGDLANILLYHVLSGKVLSSDLSDGQVATTLLGEDIMVSIDADGNIFINNAQIIVADLEADNGVVHVIDAVLLPPDEVDCEDVVTGGTVALDDGSTEITIIVDEEADVLTFTSEGADEDANFTYVITDDNNNILAIPEGNMADLNGAGVGVCRVWGLSYTGDLTAMGGDNVDQADLSSECFELSDNFITVTREEEGDMLPATVVDIILESEVHNTLEEAVVLTGLGDELSGEGPFTVFAPTDAAFDALPEGVLDGLLTNVANGDLSNILLYHVLGAKVFSTDLSDGQVAPTLQGQDVEITIDADGNIFVNDAQIIVADIEAENGVVHVIDAVLLPEEEEPSDRFLEIRPPSKVVDQNAGETVFVVYSNTDWSITSDADWVEFFSPVGTGTRFIKVIYDENTDGPARTAVLNVTSTTGETGTFTLTQAGTDDFIAVSPEDIDVTAVQGSTSFDVISTGDWTLSTDADWLNVDSDSGSGNATVSVNYDSNGAFDERSATITATTTDGATATVTVTQGASEDVDVFFELRPASQEVSSDAGQVQFVIYTNAIWSISSDADWVEFFGQQGQNTAFIKVNYDANTTGETRVAELNVVTSTGESGTFTLTQTAAGAFIITNPNIDTPTIANFDLTLYPNPVSSLLNVRIDADEDRTIDVQVLDINGKLVKYYNSQAVFRGENTIQIQVDDLAGGIYYFRMIGQDVVKQTKFMVAK